MRRVEKWLTLMIVIMPVSGCCTRPESVPILSAGEMIASAEQLASRQREGCGIDDPKCEQGQFEFDVNDYFSVFDHLSMEPGFTLDYVYLRDLAGARPVVYARKINEEPFESYEGFVMANQSTTQGSYERIRHSDDYLKHVRIDDTPEGYFQFVALLIMEDQFYLWWHANYNDTRIVTSEVKAFAAFADRISNRYRRSNEPTTPKDQAVKEKIPRLDYTPTVILKDQSAIVRYVVFSEWGGFSEVRVTVKRGFPHSILHSWSKTRIRYWSGVTL